jgi:hypothetical protein
VLSHPKAREIHSQNLGQRLRAAEQPALLTITAMVPSALMPPAYGVCDFKPHLRFSIESESGGQTVKRSDDITVLLRRYSYLLCPIWYQYLLASTSAAGTIAFKIFATPRYLEHGRLERLWLPEISCPHPPKTRGGGLCQRTCRHSPEWPHFMGSSASRRPRHP